MSAPLDTISDYNCIFYVIRDPVRYVFRDQVLFDTINRSFLWIKDLGFTENHVFNGGLVNGLSMGGMSLPFLGYAFPILAVISGVTTYLTTKLTAQPSLNEQQASTQRTMNTMMPIMIFVFSIQFPAGLALYWVVSNLFQLVQQLIVLNSSKNPKEEL
jgi:YidC/Oxa1 family membrane protein insertase